MLKLFCWFSAGFNSSFYDAFQKQSSRRVLIKSCSDNIHQIYRRTPTWRCNFNKITLRHGCSPVNLLHLIFRTDFLNDSSGGAASDFLFRERFDEDWTPYTVKFCNINTKSFSVGVPYIYLKRKKRKAWKIAAKKNFSNEIWGNKNIPFNFYLKFWCLL